jgi:hypothetical protein
MRRHLLSLGVVGLVTGVLAPAPGYAQQSVNFYLGGFVPRSLDARTGGDVLVADNYLTCVDPLNCLSFRLRDFSSATVGGEWEFPLISHLDGSLGLGFYSRSVGSVNLNYTNQGADIPQTLRLRIVPFTALVRFLPLPSDAPIQPYIGAGIGVFAWRYSETGQFVDSNLNVFSANYVKSGTDTGPVVIGGVTFPLGSWGIGFEARYQSASGNLPADQFAGTKIDLGGMTYAATFKVRF